MLTSTFSIVIFSTATPSAAPASIQSRASVPSSRSSARRAFTVWFQNQMTHVFQNSSPSGVRSETVSGAGNEHVDFQLVIDANRPLTDVNVTSSILTGPVNSVIGSGNVTLYRERYINLTQESLNGPYFTALQNVSGTKWPDALPLLYRFNASTGRNYPVWVDVFIPANTKAGDYTGTLTVSASNAMPMTVSYTVVVWGFNIPLANTFPAVVGLGIPMSSLAYWGLNTSSAQEHYDVYNASYWFLVNNRLMPYNTPVPITSPNVGYFLNNSLVTNFVFPITYNMTRDQANLQKVIDNGWLSKAYTYTNDEPALSDYIHLNSYNEYIAKQASYVHSLDPSLNFQQTGYDLPTSGPLFSNITTFDFHLERFVTNGSWVQTYQQQGKQVWWYTCITPTSPVPVFDLEASLATERAIMWNQFLYGVNGMLYFSTTADMAWGQNPWVNPWEGSTVGFDPAALDGTLLYPGGPTYNPAGNPYAPVGSIRLLELRNGIQDYEMMTMLQNKIQAMANSSGWASVNGHALVSGILGSAVKSLTNYSTSYTQYSSALDTIARYIQELNSPVPVIVQTQFGDNSYTPFNTTRAESVSVYGPVGSLVRVAGSVMRLPSGGKLSTVVRLHTGQNRIAVFVWHNGMMTRVYNTVTVGKAPSKFMAPLTFAITPTSSDSLNGSLNTSSFAGHQIYNSTFYSAQGTPVGGRVQVYMTYNSSDAFFLVRSPAITGVQAPAPGIWIYVAPYVENATIARSFGIFWPGNLSSSFALMKDNNGYDEFGYGWTTLPFYSFQKVYSNGSAVAEFTVPFNALNLTLPFIAVNQSAPTPDYHAPSAGQYWGINVMYGPGTELFGSPFSFPPGPSMYPTYGDWFYESGNSARLDYAVFDPAGALPVLNTSASTAVSTTFGRSSVTILTKVRNAEGSIPFASISFSASAEGKFSNTVYEGNGLYATQFIPSDRMTSGLQFTLTVSAKGFAPSTVSISVHHSRDTGHMGWAPQWEGMGTMHLFSLMQRSGQDIFSTSPALGDGTGQ